MKPILDACCGPRGFWYDKAEKGVVFLDRRLGSYETTEDSAISVSPTVVGDYRSLPFGDGVFRMVIFDPPHLLSRPGKQSVMARWYSTLDPDTWRVDIRAGLAECFRVLARDGFMILKWGEVDVPLSSVLALTDRVPLFGQRSGRGGNVHWQVFSGVPSSAPGPWVRGFEGVHLRKVRSDD